MNLKPGFARFLGSEPERLHFAAHSHHPWPDVSFEAHQQAWLDASEMMDDKWEHVFGTVIPETQTLIAERIGVSDPATIAFAPNTQDFVARLFSCLDPPVRVLTTDGEFHSFTRQSRRWEEAGLALVDRVPTEPHDTFSARFTREARAGVHDLIYLSQVFFDSGFIVDDIDRIVSSIPEDRAFVVVDGYHAFMAMPVNIGSIQDRVFYLAGGYKYAMSGEGVCFMHCPPGYGHRPVDTGWYAGFGQLESGVSDVVPYSEDGTRFSGATYDPSGVYRMRAVLSWLQDEQVSPTDIRQHVTGLEERFVESGASPGELVVGDLRQRGNFLVFRTERAAEIYQSLHGQKIITDYRRDRLRIGFGVYQDAEDVDRLVRALSASTLEE